MNRFFAILLWPVYWMVFPLRIRASVAVIVGDEILTVKHWLGYGTWQLPGGGVKFREPPVRTAVREIKEELGLEFQEKDLLVPEKGFEVIREFGIVSRHKFFIVKMNKKPVIKPNKEVLDYAWLKSDATKIRADVKHIFSSL